MQIFSATAIAFGLYVSLTNWATVFRSGPEENISPVPLLGGILLAAGLLSFEATRGYWWVAVIIDFGTLGFLMAIPSLVYQSWLHSDRNAAYKFKNTTDDRTSKITLFKNGDAVIDISFDPPRPYGERGDRAVSIGYVAKWSRTSDDFELSGYAGGREMTIRSSPRGYCVTETYPDGHDPSIYALDGIIVAQENDKR